MKTLIQITTFDLDTEPDDPHWKALREWRASIKPIELDSPAWGSFLQARIEILHPDAEVKIVWKAKGKSDVKVWRDGVDESSDAFQAIVREQIIDAWSAWCNAGLREGVEN